MLIGITHRLAILVAAGALTASLRRQAVVPAGDHWWSTGVPVLQESPETVHAPRHMSEIGDGAKGAVLLPDSTREGTTKAGDRSDPTRSRSARSRCLRTSDYRAFR